MELTRRQLILGGAALGACSIAPREESFHPQVFDLCVIGSGFAGTFLGLRAVQMGLKTALIEAGGDASQPSSEEMRLRDSFRFFTSGSEAFGVDKTRMITVGGTSQHWGGVMSRLWPDDLEMKTRYGVAVDWPLSYSALQPYYCESERLLLTRGHPLVPGAEPERSCPYPSLKEVPYVEPGLDVDGEDVRWFHIARSRRGRGAMRLADEEVPRFAASEGATLLQAHQATRLVTLDGRTIDHLETRRPDGSLARIRARRFVVAAGPVESARLLLLSRSEWFPNGLGNDNDLVGRHFNCHPSYESRFARRQDAGVPLGQHRTSSLKPAYRLAGLNATHYQLDIGAEKMTVRVQPEFEAVYENRVSLLEGSGDLFGNPLPDVRLTFTERDEATIGHTAEVITEMQQRMALSPDDRNGYRRWRGHPAGTCRAASSEREGVVDSDLRVFGTENLYISGAAVFPTSGTANPTNTVVALTLRLADHLLALQSA